VFQLLPSFPTLTRSKSHESQLGNRIDDVSSMRFACLLPHLETSQGQLTEPSSEARSKLEDQARRGEPHHATGLAWPAPVLMDIDQGDAYIINHCAPL
ncbi:KSR1 isoform 11, partial [Pan troglodytes]